ncbi:APN2 [Hepatospora eriocheir]|uniref:APN2 n=1 Tax=Hepatospora eriocheir TaxID=1081669 RepID=A0A1X0QFC7_9MICR|nr:APN2 [Hepatospora eriocheir]
MPYYNGNKDMLVDDYKENEEFEDKIKSVYHSLEKEFIKHCDEKVIILGDLNAAYQLKDIFLYQQEYKKILTQGEKFSYSIPLESNLITKINPSVLELPYEFKNFKSLLEYFFIVWQRKWLKNFIEKYNLIDSFRMFDQRTNIYTCWNIEKRLRPKNLGSRIDLILCNFKEVNYSSILNRIIGSDHCPVVTDFLLEKYEDNKNNLVNKEKNTLVNYLRKK